MRESSTHRAGQAALRGAAERQQPSAGRTDLAQSARAHVAATIAACEARGLLRDNRLVDLGCGDGRWLVAARRHCRRLVGYDIDGALEKGRAALDGADHTLVEADFFESENIFEDGDVVVAYPSARAREAPGRSSSGELRRGTLVCVGFEMRGWRRASKSPRAGSSRGCTRRASAAGSKFVFRAPRPRMICCKWICLILALTKVLQASRAKLVYNVTLSSPASALVIRGATKARQNGYQCSSPA